MSRVLDLIKSVSGNGSTADATTTNTPAVTENSKKIANTEWVRSAMANIASTAGFTISKTANGHIQLPSWLGGLIIQWGFADDLVTFPIPFPNAVLSIQLTPIATQEESTTPMAAWVRAYTKTSIDINRSVANFNVFWFAIGH